MESFSKCHSISCCAQEINGLAKAVFFSQTHALQINFLQNVNHLWNFANLRWKDILVRCLYGEDSK
jgi:hypothetical protein